MGMQCAICGKKPILGNQYTHRGKAKYLGGVGRKVTGCSSGPSVRTSNAFRSIRAAPFAVCAFVSTAFAAAGSNVLRGVSCSRCLPCKRRIS